MFCGFPSCSSLVLSIEDSFGYHRCRPVTFGQDKALKIAEVHVTALLATRIPSARKTFTYNRFGKMANSEARETTLRLGRKTRVDLTIFSSTGMKADIQIPARLTWDELASIASKFVLLNQVNYLWKVSNQLDVLLLSKEGSLELENGDLVLAARSELSRLPISLTKHIKGSSMSSTQSLRNEDGDIKLTPAELFLPFYGKAHAFSQWHTCNFRDPEDGVMYNCCEQYMMAKKASLFKDTESLGKILSSLSPGAQKALGRKVKNFDDSLWRAHRLAIVTRGNYLKFSQNPDLQKFLLQTGTRVIVEASRDAVWGSGKSRGHPKEFDQISWGVNLLGLALMCVREYLSQRGPGFNFVVENQVFYLNPKAESDIAFASERLPSIFPSDASVAVYVQPETGHSGLTPSV
mmetsp:Transcript_7756/g.15397  ORF Transcript_7756/g.15397 Transcript_7756/m.15397 type:complete len:406 (+) Transcript_7756:93-1310(+)